MLLLCFVVHINSNPVSITIKRQVFSTYIRIEKKIFKLLTLLDKSPEVAKLEILELRFFVY